MQSVCCEDSGCPQRWLCCVKSQTDWICHSAAFGWRKRFREILIAHMCNLAWNASIQYRFGADGVLWPLSLCRYCHWVKSFAKPEQKCTADMVCHARSILSACWKCFITCLAETSCTSETLSGIYQNPLLSEGNLRFVSMHAYKMLMLPKFSSLLQSAAARVAAGLPAFFFWLLLSSRDKVQRWLPAPWKITEVVRRKDSGSQLQCSGGQLEPFFGMQKLIAAAVQPEAHLAAFDVLLLLGWWLVGTV